RAVGHGSVVTHEAVAAHVPFIAAGKATIGVPVVCTRSRACCSAFPLVSRPLYSWAGRNPAGMICWACESGPLDTARTLTMESVTRSPVREIVVEMPERVVRTVPSMNGMFRGGMIPSVTVQVVPRFCHCHAPCGPSVETNVAPDGAAATADATDPIMDPGTSGRPA